MRFDDLQDLLAPDRLPYQSGVERLANGVLHVAALTRMPGVTPRMIEWWFGEYLQTTEHYRRWHPRDHVWMSWQDKEPATHVGAKHLVHEYVGGKLQKLRIHFVPTDEYFRAGLGDEPSTVAICARAGWLAWPVDHARMVHLALARDWGCELHSRFWLGYVESRNDTRLVRRIGNLPWLRRLATPMSFGRALALHCHEEMTTLGTFLPALYAENASTR